MRVVWFATLVFGGAALFIFINDTNRAYADMLDSMKRYAKDNPDFVVEQVDNPGSGLESSISGSAAVVTRDASPDLTAVVPVAD